LQRREIKAGGETSGKGEEGESSFYVHADNPRLSSGCLQTSAAMPAAEGLFCQSTLLDQDYLRIHHPTWIITLVGVAECTRELLAPPVR
jgi:hypothetical protein